MGLTAAATATGAVYGGGAIGMALAVIALVMLAPVARAVFREARQVVDVLEGVMRDHGMQELATEALDASRTTGSSWRGLPAAHGS